MGCHGWQPLGVFATPPILEGAGRGVSFGGYSKLWWLDRSFISNHEGFLAENINTVFGGVGKQKLNKTLKFGETISKLQITNDSTEFCERFPTSKVGN